MLNYLFTNTPLMFFIQSFWRDEAFSYLLAKKNLLDILVITAKDFNPPLYYLVLHFWMKIFGSSEIALRSLSLIFFWATIYIFFLFLNKILKIKSAWFTLTYLLFPVSNSLLLYYAFEARMYTMLAFFATTSFYAFYKKNFILYILSTILGLYTHYFMIFVILTQLIFLFFSNKQKNISQLLITNYLIIFLLFFPWLIFVLIQKGDLFQPFWIEKMNLRSFVSLLGAVYTGYEPAFKFFDKSILKLSIAFVSLYVVGYLKINQEKFTQKKLFYFLLIWGIGIPIIVGVISFFKPLFLPRYLIFSTVGFLLLVIFIIETLPILPRLIILFLLFIVTINYHQLQIKHRKKADLRKTIKEIKFLAKKDDVLYVTSELDFHTARYYFNEDRVYIYGKSYEEIPNYVGKILIPKEKITNKLPLYPKKAFILTSETQYEIQSRL